MWLDASCTEPCMAPSYGSNFGSAAMYEDSVINAGESENEDDEYANSRRL
jgi:hypothetical protein